MQKKEATAPEVVKIFHFDTQFDREEWCIWHVHLATAQGRVLSENIYEYISLSFISFVQI
jgi:hypothetical protein